MIVCGYRVQRSKLSSRLKVACAARGAYYLAISKLKTKLRGQPSRRDALFIFRLGIDVEADGIIELPLDAPIGTDLREYLALDDNAIEISLTPNRADV